MEKIYLDHAATTPVDPRVLEVMNKFHTENFGNASSVHSFGREAAKALDKAREDVADFLHADFHEIIFTSGATEANNIAIMGLIKKFVLKHKGQKKFHVITSSIEHSSVREVFKHMAEMGMAELTVIPVDESGIVNPDDVKDAIKENTILVSIMMANNEIGTIQPIRKIGKLIKKFNEREDRAVHIKQSTGDKDSKFTAYDKVYFHTDAVQAANYSDLNVEFLHVDLMTISAHKIYGPKGAGALYIKAGTPIDKIMFGGDQENSLRPGTHNLPAIVGLAVACNLITPEFRDAESKRQLDLRNYLWSELKKNIPSIILNGDLEERLPNNLNISIPGKSGEMMLLNLDQQGVAVSTGSACASAAIEPSHVLAAMDFGDERINSALRITLGRSITKEDLDFFVKKLILIVS